MKATREQLVEHVSKAITGITGGWTDEEQVDWAEEARNLLTSGSGTCHCGKTAVCQVALNQVYTPYCREHYREFLDTF